MIVTPTSGTLGLISGGTPDGACAVGSACAVTATSNLGSPDGARSLSTATQEAVDAGYGNQVYPFLKALLQANPGGDWDSYIELAAKTDHADEALKFVQDTLARTDLTPSERQTVGANHMAQRAPFVGAEGIEVAVAQTLLSAEGDMSVQFALLGFGFGVRVTRAGRTCGERIGEAVVALGRRQAVAHFGQ